MNFFSSARTAENRTRWKGIVAKSSAVSNDPARLRDRMAIENNSIFGNTKIRFLMVVDIQ